MGCSFSSVVIVPIDGPSGELPCAGERRLVPVGVAMRQRCVSPTKSPTSLADAYDEVARGRGTIVRSCKTIAKLQYLAIVGAVEIIPDRSSICQFRLGPDRYLPGKYRRRKYRCRDQHRRRK